MKKLLLLGFVFFLGFNSFGEGVKSKSRKELLCECAELNSHFTDLLTKRLALQNEIQKGINLNCGLYLNTSSCHEYQYAMRAVKQDVYYEQLLEDLELKRYTCLKRLNEQKEQQDI